MFTMSAPMWVGAADGGGDPLYGSVVFLVSPRYYVPAGAVNDLSTIARAGTQVGSPTVSNSVLLFGGNTLSVTADGAGWTFHQTQAFPAATDFCFEAFIRTTTAARSHVFFSTSAAAHWWSRIENLSPDYFGFASSGYGASNGPDILVDTWYHVAATYQASTNTKRLFVDGIARGASAGASVSSASTGLIHVGHPAAPVAAADSTLRGYCGGVRMTMGNKRYADGGFAALTEQFVSG